MADRSTITRRGMLLGAALLAAGCAGLDDRRTVILDERELQQLLERDFPLDRRLLEMLDVTVNPPKLRLLPESNRLATEWQISTRDRLFGGAWVGRLALDSALRYEPGDQSVRLLQVRVRQFSLDGGGSLARSQAERLGAVLAETVLENFAIYRLSPERAARLQRAGATPASVTVTSRGVEITLAPTAR